MMWENALMDVCVHQILRSVVWSTFRLGAIRLYMFFVPKFLTGDYSDFINMSRYIYAV